MAGRSNQEWLDALSGPGRDQATADLRLLLVRGLRYAFAGPSGVTDADLEDFAQEALMKILGGLDSFRRESRFTTWAHKIAVHEALTELRRRRWRDVSLEDLTAQHGQSEDTIAALGDPDVSPEREAERQIVVAMLQRLVDEELTDRQRQAMVAVMRGMSLAEVARRMETNRNALYKLLHDARQRLRKQIVAEGHMPEDLLAAFDS
jgi:RNA polymerase sigma-70 factor (ECF subfamily)